MATPSDSPCLYIWILSVIGNSQTLSIPSGLHKITNVPVGGEFFIKLPMHLVGWISGKGYIYKGVGGGECKVRLNTMILTDLFRPALGPLLVNKHITWLLINYLGFSEDIAVRWLNSANIYKFELAVVLIPTPYLLRQVLL